MRKKLSLSKKTITFIFSLLILIAPAYAGRVTSEQALKKATRFMSGKTFRTPNSQRRVQGTSTEANVPPFYVFNATDGGFVIVSGDDRTREILGYSTTETLNLDNLPANLQWWLDEYARQIESLDVSTTPIAASRKLSSVPSISPLLQTKWDQYGPYNYRCPDGKGKDWNDSGYDANNRCVTGCVATAMAQVMNYWEWPASCPTLEAYSTDKFYVKSLPSTNFKWNLMKDTYSINETGEAADAVAELMRYCGQAVKMDYDTSGSGSAVTKEVLTKIFNYSPSIERLCRYNYNIDDWESIIYQELAEGRPVLYEGESRDGGHEFVIDGYASNGLFHINWGWGGNCDDYFVLSVADPYRPGVSGGSSSSGYRYDQMALIGVKPFREGEIEPYAVLSNDFQTATFYYDGHMVSRHGIAINNSSLYDFDSPYGSATTAVIDDSFANYHPKSTAYWFQKCASLTKITGMNNINTENVTDMDYMFAGCSALTSLDVSGFNTDKVIYMCSMFSGCSSLTSLDVNGFNTDNVTDMGWMFYNCPSLTSLDVSGFNTDKVTDMSCMFYNCPSLTSLDVSGFNTDKVTSMNNMFYNCSSLTSLDVSGFKTNNVIYMRSMFSGCSSLTSLDVNGFNTDNVTDMNDMFYNCSSLTSLDVSGFKTNNVIFMSSMFYNCSSLKSLDVSGFKTNNVIFMSIMFSGCSSLKSLDVSGFKTNNVIYMGRMFSGCSSLTSLDVSGFNTDNVTDMSWMFFNCSSLTTIYAGEGWSTSNVKSSDWMFYGCSKLIGGQGTKYNASNTNHTYARIDGGLTTPGYFTATESTGIVAPQRNPERKGQIYNLRGQKLNGLQRGINIVDGKKIFHY